MLANIQQKIKESLVVKMLLILVLLLLLLIPLSFVQDILRERYQTNNEVSVELTNSWGSAQLVNGPVLIIPFEKKITTITTEKDKEISNEVVYTKYLHVLPQTLNINSTIHSEVLKRSIYQAVVYESKNQITGSFAGIDYNKYMELTDKDKALLDDVEVVLNVTDVRGVKSLPILKIGDKEYKLTLRKKENKSEDFLLTAKVAVADLLAGGFQFQLMLDISGSKSFNIHPIAEENTIKVSSNWSDPSFKGNYLTLDKVINDDGFTADWSISNVLNEVPPVFVDNSFASDLYTYSISDVDNSLATYERLPKNNTPKLVTIQFFDQMNNYTKSEKITKYAVLVIILTFTSIFFSEIYSKVRVHIINYLLIGLGVIVFYLLLLSISEFLSFNLSYLIASVATIGLITNFIRLLVPQRKVVLSIGFVLSVLYLFIFILIQLKEQALLVGSIGLFFILALLMNFSARFKLGNKD